MQTEKRGWWHKKGRYIHVFRSKLNVGLHFNVHLVESPGPHGQLWSDNTLRHGHSHVATRVNHTSYTEWRYLVFNHPDGLFPAKPQNPEVWKSLKIGLKCGFMWPKDTFPFFIGSSSRLREFSSISRFYWYMPCVRGLSCIFWCSNKRCLTEGFFLCARIQLSLVISVIELCLLLFFMLCCQRVQSHKQSALIFAQSESE